MEGALKGSDGRSEDMSNQLLQEGLEVNRSEGEEPPSTKEALATVQQLNGQRRAMASTTSGNRSEEPGALKRAADWIAARLWGRNGEQQQLRDALEEIIGEIEDPNDEEAMTISGHERTLLSNILKLRHLTAYDVMVPRADIVALPLDADFDRVLETIAERGHSRMPVYRGSLDDIAGVVHVKDVLAASRRGNFRLASILRPAEFIAPSMRVLDLLLEMRLKRSHLALVVDEFGGVDGLVTVEDLIEEIVGEIEDEHDVIKGPNMAWRPDGTLIADARTPVEDFEEEVGPVLSEEEREEDIDTIGGLVTYLAGHVPARGELIEHPTSGITFEVVQADPRRVKRLRLRNLPPRPEETADA